MSQKKEEKVKAPEPGKKLDPHTLEEEDEFEEFPVEDWHGKDNEEEEDDVNVWEDNWDDESVEDDFSKQLRAELEKHGHKAAV
uniref:26S proteasome complex subunit dss-1 n=1 Tax=Plectus sambesii TaxID=2011161 RepID=A0A914XL41_9BILA